MAMLRQIEMEITNGKPTPQAYNEAAITVQTYYGWRKENTRLKRDRPTRLDGLFDPCPRILPPVQSRDSALPHLILHRERSFVSLYTGLCASVQKRRAPARPGGGKQNRRRGTRFCPQCAATATRENFDAGRASAQQSDSLAKRSTTQRQHKWALQNWRPSDLPGWLTRDVYVEQVQPALATVTKSRIRSALGVSEPYSSDIQAGKRIPHPRHWQALAQLAGVSANRSEQQLSTGGIS